MVADPHIRGRRRAVLNRHAITDEIADRRIFDVGALGHKKVSKRIKRKIELDVARAGEREGLSVRSGDDRERRVGETERVFETLVGAGAETVDGAE